MTSRPQAPQGGAQQAQLNITPGQLTALTEALSALTGQSVTHAGGVPSGLGIGIAAAAAAGVGGGRGRGRGGRGGAVRGTAGRGRGGAARTAVRPAALGGILSHTPRPDEDVDLVDREEDFDEEDEDARVTTTARVTCSDGLTNLTPHGALLFFSSPPYACRVARARIVILLCLVFFRAYPTLAPPRGPFVNL